MDSRQRNHQTVVFMMISSGIVLTLLLGLILVVGGSGNGPTPMYRSPEEPPSRVIPTTAMPAAAKSPGETPTPDSKGEIAFTCTPQGYNQICLMGVDGNHRRQLTDGNAHNYYPSISPNGEAIVFASNRTRAEYSI